MNADTRTLLWLLHVPRTGGTFLAQQVRLHCETIEIIRHEHEGYSTDRHTAYIVTRRPLVLVTMLRDPVEHARSLHAYIQRQPEHPLHGLAARLGVVEFLRVYPGGFGNFFVKFFAPTTGTVVEAMHTLARVKYVLDTADLTTQANDMLDQIGEPGLLPEREPPAAKVPITVAEIDYIKNERAGDYALLRGLAQRGQAYIKLEH